MPLRRAIPPGQTVSTGFVVAVVGFFSSFPIVLQGLAAMGATEVQAASGLAAAAFSMGLAGIALSLWKGQPISVAWSTPGVAVLAVMATPAGGFSEAVGAFLIAGILTLVAGLVRPIGRLAAAIPPPLAQAMLAGVLVALCTAPFLALAEVPETALPIILTWFIVGRFSGIFAVPAAVVAAFLLTLWTNDFTLTPPDQILSRLTITAPSFTASAVFGIALPLFIVTMATQNIPGIAVLRSFGYTPPPGQMLTGVGAASVASAPFGAPATCLAAITAAMCAGEDSHPDRTLRYWSAVMAGVFYCVLGLFAAVITVVAAAAPPMTLETLAGIALLGVFANSAQAALDKPEYREAAAVTFLVTASGITIIGLSAAVWGLVLGGVVQLAKMLKR
ncbi:benzoate/H(+) symporter BenE family transporter [Aestuariibius sp. 2305UL40-4]|uniref:benzoate/H(+) symporter BenE family transporter n=1 Tax=Aestuariibius violaceus TaxID=3234132 RepID=UPI00346ADC2F